MSINFLDNVTVTGILSSSSDLSTTGRFLSSGKDLITIIGSPGTSGITSSILKTSDFTATAGGNYSTFGNITISDPLSASLGSTYSVGVLSGTTTIGSTAPIITPIVGSKVITLSGVTVPTAINYNSSILVTGGAGSEYVTVLSATSATITLGTLGLSNNTSITLSGHTSIVYNSYQYQSSPTPLTRYFDGTNWTTYIVPPGLRPAYQSFAVDKIWNTTNMIYKARQADSGFQIRALIVGDSWASCPTNALVGQFGFGGTIIPAPQASLQGTATVTTPGGTEYTTFSASPPGYFITLTPSGSATFGGAFGYPIIGHQLKIYYIAEPGAGTLSISYQTNNIGVYTQLATVNANNTTTSVSAATFNLATRNGYLPSVTTSSGTVKVIACGILETIQPPGGGSAQGGVAVMDMSFGGLSMDQHLYAGQNNWNQYVGDFAPNLVFIKYNDSLSTVQQYFSQLISTIKTATSGQSYPPDIIVFSDHPTSGDIYGRPDVNNYYASLANKLQILYADNVDYMPPYITGLKLGWYNEGTIGSTLNYNYSSATNIVTVSQTSTPLSAASSTNGMSITVVAASDSALANTTFTVLTGQSNSFSFFAPTGTINPSGTLQYSFAGYHLNSYGTSYWDSVTWQYLRPFWSPIWSIGPSILSYNNRTSKYVDWEMDGVCATEWNQEKDFSIVSGTQRAQLMFNTLLGSDVNYTSMGNIMATGSYKGDYADGTMSIVNPDGTRCFMVATNNCWIGPLGSPSQTLTRNSAGQLEVMCTQNSFEHSLVTSIGTPASWYSNGTRIQEWRNNASVSSGGNTLAYVDAYGNFNTTTSVSANQLWLSNSVSPAGTSGVNQYNAKSAGSINFNSGQSVLTVYNTNVTTNSVIIATVASKDATAKSVSVFVPTSGSSFDITLNAAANTTPCRVNYLVVGY